MMIKTVTTTQKLMARQAVSQTCMKRDSLMNKQVSPETCVHLNFTSLHHDEQR